MLDSVLDEQLNKHLSLHDAQFGFRTGLGLLPVKLVGTALKWVTSFKNRGHWVTATQTDDVDIEKER